MLAEIAKPVPGDEVTRRLRDENLSAVSGSGDPRRAMDVHSHVALLRDHRLAGVQTHTHTDRTALKSIARVSGSR